MEANFQDPTAKYQLIFQIVSSVMSDHQPPPPNSGSLNSVSPKTSSKTSQRRKGSKTRRLRRPLAEDYTCESENSATPGGTKDFLNPKLSTIKDTPSNKFAEQGTSTDISFHTESSKSFSTPSLRQPLDPELRKYDHDTAGNELDLYNINSQSLLSSASPFSSTPSNAPEAVGIRTSQKTSNLLDVKPSAYPTASTQSREFMTSSGVSSQHCMPVREVSSQPYQSKETDDSMLLIEIPVSSTSLKSTSTPTRLEASNLNIPQSVTPNLSKEVSANWDLLSPVPWLDGTMSTSSGYVQQYLSPLLPTKNDVPATAANVTTTLNINVSLGNESTIGARSTTSTITPINVPSTSQSVSPHTRITDFEIVTTKADFWTPPPLMYTKRGSLVATTQPLSDLERCNVCFKIPLPPTPAKKLSTNPKQKAKIRIPPSVKNSELSSPSLTYEKTATTMVASTISKLRAVISAMQPPASKSFSPFMSQETLPQLSTTRTSTLHVLESAESQPNFSKAVPQSTSSPVVIRTPSSEAPSWYESPGVKQPSYWCYLPSTSQSPWASLESTSRVSITTQPSSSPVLEEEARCSSLRNSTDSSIEIRVTSSPEDCVVLEELRPSPPSVSEPKEPESGSERLRAEIIRSSTTGTKVKKLPPIPKLLESLPTSGSAASYYLTPPPYLTAEMIDFTELLDLSSKSVSKSNKVHVVFDLPGSQESSDLQNMPPPVTHSLETMYTRRDSPLPTSFLLPSYTEMQLPVSNANETSPLSITTKTDLSTNFNLGSPFVLLSAPLTTIAPSKPPKRARRDFRSQLPPLAELSVGIKAKVETSAPGDCAWSTRELPSPMKTSTSFEFVSSAISGQHDNSCASMPSIEYYGEIKKQRLESPHQDKSVPKTRSSQELECTMDEKQHDVPTYLSVATVPQTCCFNIIPLTQSVLAHSKSTAEFLSLSNDCNVISAGSLKPIVSFTPWQATANTTAGMERDDILAHPSISGSTEAPQGSSAAGSVKNTNRMSASTNSTTSAPEALLIEFNRDSMPTDTSEPSATVATSIPEPVRTTETDYWARLLPQLVTYTNTASASDNFQVPLASAVPQCSTPLLNPSGAAGRSSETANITSQDMVERLYWLLIRQEAHLLQQEELQEEHERMCLLHRRFYRKVWRRLQDQVDLLRVLNARLREQEP